MNSAFEKIWYAPAFSSLLENRREGIVIVGAGVVHLGLSFAGLPGWRCPILAATGIPCPGCGLTRATMQLVYGDFSQSFHTHAFASVFLLALLVLVVAFILPEKNRKEIFSNIKNIETRSGITSYLLLALMMYWCIRLMGIIPFPNFF